MPHARAPAQCHHHLRAATVARGLPAARDAVGALFSAGARSVAVASLLSQLAAACGREDEGPACDGARGPVLFLGRSEEAQLRQEVAAGGGGGPERARAARRLADWSVRGV